LATIETNTARGRRVADLVRAYLMALGNPANIERQAAVIQAAELTVLAEEVRAAALRSGTGDLVDQVVRVQGAADRAIRRLHIEATEAPQPSIRDVLAAEHEVRLAREEAETADDADEAADADPGEPEAAA
jgi:hypothetical protein